MTSTHERDTLIETLQLHRGFLLHTAEGLTEDEARRASTTSELSIASILKHVADTEEQWVRFALEGPSAFAEPGGEDNRFDVPDEKTLDALRERAARVAAATEELLRTADLDADHPLPVAPWFPAGARWSVRRVALHILAETSQHAGHADSR